MAQVTVENTVVRDIPDITRVLQEQGIGFERWSIDRLPALLGAGDTLAPDQKEQVLATFAPEIQTLIERRGYRTADVVVLSPATPGLDTLLETFGKEHYHTEDEVRFVVDGEGVFSIRGTDNRIYEVLVQPGDLLIVPAGTWHWFGLTEQRRIKCLRVFQTTEGWNALFKEPAVA